MTGMIVSNWVAFAAALLIGLLVAWWLFGRATTTAPRRDHRPDVLDEGAAPAQRNQALIDTPPAAAVPMPHAAVGMAGIGEVIGVGAQDVLDDAATFTGGDDLLRIKGLGPKLNALLRGQGITTFAQIAALSDADLDELDTHLGAFAGRPRRDGWVEQARLLAAGDVAGYEAKFGKV